MILTQSCLYALKWLAARNGDGAFCVGGPGKALLAGGETAPVMRMTWNSLRAKGLVEFYGGKSGQARCRVTDAGRKEIA